MWNLQEVYSAEGTVEHNCSIDFLPVAKHTVKTGCVNHTVVALVTDKFTLVLTCNQLAQQSWEHLQGHYNYISKLSLKYLCL